ncbi:unnamed protein product [Heligmosomoides polygyrus]|uniref:HTH_48 domain-containing protein n=1 Tax=Heligmosomoides polygyrus TaxID=6339 RepID=A0A183GRY4_HELPZ|nr:unnamed protein product [Heligmosomoides polygyrus]
MDHGRIRTFVYYEWLQGNDTGTAVANICKACKEDAVSQRTVRRWFNRFESGDTSLEDREHSGMPSTVDDDEVRRCIKEKPGATTRELATTLGYSGPSSRSPWSSGRRASATCPIDGRLLWITVVMLIRLVFQ